MTVFISVTFGTILSITGGFKKRVREASARCGAA